MPWWILAPFAVSFVGTNVFGLLAMRHLTPYGREHRRRIYIWTKLFSGRQNFTATGWRYMNCARLCALVWPASLIALVVLAS